MVFQLVPKSVTLTDLERRNGRNVGLFHRIRQENSYFCFTCRIELSSVLL